MTTTLELGVDMSLVRQPTGEPPWWPYQVPTDASPHALAAMPASALLVALHDTLTVVTRAALDDGAGTEWPYVDNDTYEALVDIRDRLEAEVHRRLREVEHLTERERLIRNRIATRTTAPDPRGERTP